MKKSILICVVLLGLSLASESQNLFTLKLGTNVCVDQIVVTYTDQTTSSYDLGCTGTYQFDEGSQVIDYVTVNGTDCPNDATTSIMVNGVPATITLKKVIQTSQTNTDAVINLIR